MSILHREVPLRYYAELSDPLPGWRIVDGHDHRTVDVVGTARVAATTVDALNAGTATVRAHAAVGCRVAVGWRAAA